MYCKNCGKELSNTTRFCDDCGQSTGYGTAPVEPADRSTWSAPSPEVQTKSPNKNNWLTVFMIVVGALLFFLVSLNPSPNFIINLFFWAGLAFGLKALVSYIKKNQGDGAQKSLIAIGGIVVLVIGLFIASGLFGQIVVSSKKINSGTTNQNSNPEPLVTPLPTLMVQTGAINYCIPWTFVSKGDVGLEGCLTAQIKHLIKVSNGMKMVFSDDPNGFYMVVEDETYYKTAYIGRCIFSQGKVMDDGNTLYFDLIEHPSDCSQLAVFNKKVEGYAPNGFELSYP